MHNNFLNIAHKSNAVFKKTQRRYERLIKAIKKLKPNTFTFGNKIIRLNEEQTGVVYEDVNENILILACAGSGKTTTILCRIKYLVDQGIDPRSIVLTTFTRDATNNMKSKLDTMFGYKLPIEVGTIDSISKKNIIRYGGHTNDQTVNVGEYSIRFLRFLRSHPNRGDYMQHKKYLFVDEFQDINEIQSDIITEFYKSGVKVIAVGDDGQSIYNWRGSSVDYILNFPTRYDNVSVHKLIQNYRSTPEIVKFANESIERNTYQIPKKMVAVNPSINNGLPTVKFYHKWDLQNLFIRDKILYYISHGVPRHEIAILSRTKFPLYSLEETLTKNSIQNVYLDGEGDVRTKIRDDHVCLSTVHKAKGLEWTVVFIINLNDNSFPSGKTPLELEEERRLFYVAVTRAKKYLHMSFYPSYKSIYVSRFVSEIDDSLYNFEKYDPKYVGLVEESSRENKLSIKELVRNLDGPDYMKLRDLGIMPNLEFKKVQIYERYDYLDFIKDNDIYSDFCGFIDCLISRMIGGQDKGSGGLYYEPALLAIANIKLSQREFNIYKQYELNFQNNLEKLELTDDDEDIIQKLGPINSHERDVIINIVDKLFTNASRFDVPFYKIPVFSERFLPTDFEQLMEVELQRFTSRKNGWQSIIKCIWEISKCEKIVNDGRRRLLYKDFNLEDLNKYAKLYSDINERYVAGLKDIKKTCHLNLKLDNGVYGEVDLLVKDIVIDFNTSNNKDMNAAWILHTLCYVHLCREKGLKADRIQIFNPLMGNIFVAKVDEWDRGAELIEYLLAKRTKLLERTKMLEQMQKAREKEETEAKKSRCGNDDSIVIPKAYMFT